MTATPKCPIPDVDLPEELRRQVLAVLAVAHVVLMDYIGPIALRAAALNFVLAKDLIAAVGVIGHAAGHLGISFEEFLAATGGIMSQQSGMAPGAAETKH